jgi:hypothetical protein
MHNSLALLQKFLSKRCRKAAPIGAAFRERFDTSIKQTTTHIKRTAKVLSPEPGTLLQMAAHFPHCSAGGRSDGPPTGAASEFSRRTKDVFLKTPLPPLSPDLRAGEAPSTFVTGEQTPRSCGRKGTRPNLDEWPYQQNTSDRPSPKLRRRYARVLGAVDCLDQSAKVVDSLKQIS